MIVKLEEKERKWKTDKWEFCQAAIVDISGVIEEF